MGRNNSNESKTCTTSTVCRAIGVRRAGTLVERFAHPSSFKFDGYFQIDNTPEEKERHIPLSTSGASEEIVNHQMSFTLK